MVPDKKKKIPAPAAKIKKTPKKKLTSKPPSPARVSPRLAQLAVSRAGALSPEDLDDILASGNKKKKSMPVVPGAPSWHAQAAICC